MNVPKSICFYRQYVFALLIITLLLSYISYILYVAMMSPRRAGQPLFLFTHMLLREGEGKQGGAD